jgi:hypothetical protein
VTEDSLILAHPPASQQSVNAGTVRIDDTTAVSDLNIDALQSHSDWSEHSSGLLAWRVALHAPVTKSAVGEPVKGRAVTANASNRQHQSTPSTNAFCAFEAQGRDPHGRHYSKARCTRSTRILGLRRWRERLTGLLNKPSFYLVQHRHRTPSRTASSC